MGSTLAVTMAAGVALFLEKVTDVTTWCKWIIAYAHIKLHRWSVKSRFDLYDMDALNDPVKIGLLPPQEESILESPHDETHLSQAADEIVFCGVNSKSECFVARVSRLADDETEVGLYLKIKNGRSYALEKVRCQQETPMNRAKVFAGGGLKMYYTVPMRKWRIVFKGLLREAFVDDENSSRMVYVKFGLQWRASTDCFDTLTDISCSSLASALSARKWDGWLPDLSKFHKAVDAYYQFGVIRGEVHIDGIDPDLELYLFAEKLRYLGNIPRVGECKFSHILGHIAKDGRMIHISELHIPNAVESLTFGYVVNPEGIVQAASKFDVKGGDLWNKRSLDMGFRTDEQEFNFKISSCEENASYECGTKQEHEISMDEVTLELNSRPGRGVFIKGYISKPRRSMLLNHSQKIVSVQKDIPLVVDFSSDICQVQDVTGGKGSSLGKLTRLSKKNQNFIVPKGIVVTTSGYEKFTTKAVLKDVEDLADVLYGNAPGDVKSVCERTVSAVVRAELPNALLHAIIENLRKEFGADCFHKKFAVRSSATGEDGEDMSAAGQMETYLGVTTLEQITLCVKKCWASQFSYVAVQYKRQNGQLLNSPMAVVIQEMVMCDVAGVLFTCDPVSGNPTLMSISANYGLGESVVSGSEEPDTLILERSSDDSLKMKDKVIGLKGHRNVIGENGLIKEEVPEASRSICALSDELSLCLGKIAIHIEKCYGCERDIEWGLLHDNFYIFQSRPVTTGDEESDYEIDHENDTPLRIENEYFSVCNLGEVMPGATSQLSIDAVINFFNAIFQRSEFKLMRPFTPKYCSSGFCIMYNHVVNTVSDVFSLINEGSNILKTFMICYFGRIIEDEQLIQFTRERFRFRKKIPMTKMLYRMSYDMMLSFTFLKKQQRYYENNGIALDAFRTAHELFQALIHTCSYPFKAFACHMLCTGKSMTSTLLLLSLIEKTKGEIDTDSYNDFSEILSAISDVESADVPSVMESLAWDISNNINPAEFQKMSAEDAENWLLSNTSESGEKFRDFLKKHGHRCLKEFDIRTPTWSESPGQLVKLLQNLTGHVTENKSKRKSKSFEEILANLKSPINTKTRIILKYLLLPFSRNGVQVREASKSVLIRALNEWRKGYRKLSKLMVSEGRIPDADLLYFMTLLEIQELLKTRSPKIIARAIHRRRRYPILDSYIFPEISSGIPKPANIDHYEIENTDENFSMKGIPVSKGIAKGYLRVALTLEEASFVQPGEILLTYSTDIGWSPYFPVLAGLGTELGGLISHGAVVSREYGIPCIAALHGATRHFKTGDYVLMDANRGVLKRLSE